MHEVAPDGLLQANYLDIINIKHPPVILVEGRVNLETLDQIWVSQVGAAVCNSIAMVSIDRRNPRGARVAARCDECTVESAAEHLQRQSMSGQSGNTRLHGHACGRNPSGRTVQSSL